MNKKITALLLFSLLWIQFNVFSYEYKDVKDNIAVSVLTQLGILEGDENGYFNPDGYVTRAEFAVILTKMLKAAEADMKNDHVVINDITEHWAYKSIMTAVDLGIIDGYADNNFLPDAYVSGHEAVKMLMCALGYSRLAGAKGGYPYGYLTVAKEKGLLSSFNVDFTKALTRLECAVLAFNGLSVPIFNPVSFSDEIAYKSDKGVNILTQYFKLYEAEGVISANEYTSLTSAGGRVNKGFVMIDNTLFDAGSAVITAHLGKRLKLYYDEDNIVRAYYVSKGNKEMYIDADDISDISDNRILYDENNKEKNIRLKNPISVIYNGVSLGDETIIPENGGITAIDNNDDNIYEILYITDYFNIAVQAIDNNKVYGKANSLDLDSSVYDITVILEGKEVGFSEIKQNDILSVIKSRESFIGNPVIIYITRNVIQGEISEIEIENNKAKYKINGTFYYLSKYFSEPEKLEAGKSLKFYLDYKNKIVITDDSDITGERFGFIISGSNKGLSDIKLKIFEINETISIFNLSDKVFIDNAYYSGADIFTKLLSTSDSQTNDISQFVKYSLNSKGAIHRIYTKEAVEELKPGFYNIGSTAVTYSQTNTSFYSSLGSDESLIFTDLAVSLSDNTVVFMIPTDRSLDDEYIIRKHSTFQDSKNYRLEAYDLNEIKTARFIVTYYAGTRNSGTNLSSPVAVFNSKSTAVNKDGDLVEKVNYYRDGSLTTSLCVRNDIFTDFKQGDIFRLAQNSDKEITNITKMFDIDNVIVGVYAEGEYKNIHKSQFKTYTGTVLAKKDGKILLTASLTPDLDTDLNTDIFNISKDTVIYTLSGNQLKSAGYDNIIGYFDSGGEASSIFLYAQYGLVKLILIF